MEDANNGWPGRSQVELDPQKVYPGEHTSKHMKNEQLCQGEISSCLRVILRDRVELKQAWHQGPPRNKGWAASYYYGWTWPQLELSDVLGECFGKVRR